jgi:hypothetical protein
MRSMAPIAMLTSAIIIPCSIAIWASFDSAMLLSPATRWRNTPPKDGYCQIKGPPGRLAGQKVQFAWDIFPCLIRPMPANQNAQSPYLVCHKFVQHGRHPFG